MDIGLAAMHNKDIQFQPPSAGDGCGQVEAGGDKGPMIPVHQTVSQPLSSTGALSQNGLFSMGVWRWWE